MAGVVRVVDSSANQPPATPRNSLPGAGVTGQSTAPTLSASSFSDPDNGDVHVASQWIVRNVGTGALVLDTDAHAEHLELLPLTGLSYGTTYSWKVRYLDDRGAWSGYSAETPFTTVADPASAGTGLLATYGKYNLKADRFIALVTQTDATVDFDWGLGKPISGTPANKFFVRWEGRLLPEFSETYLIRVVADGGVRLWVDGVLIIDDWIVTPFAVFRSARAPLQAGVPASIRLEYFDMNGPASVSLRWASRSRPPEVIPSTHLLPPQL
jgi:hypothetical protein